ncbi:MAG TPA: site-specific DNA-methyltransferase, partial [Bacteroidia bacterium]|nr:site-specific DNA-methyltransferase [Bacteroidia bacterium]
MDGESLDILTTQLDKVKKLFPEVITEGKIDWEKLQATLGRENFEFRNERYVLNWAGKSESFKVLQQSTTATLKPVVEESINFDTTENVFIEGENLEVLKILQKAYYGKIKCILIDPPYNTGSDSFIYPDSFKESREDYLKRIGDKDEEGLLMREGFFRKNSKDSGHFHSNWLSMMYPRLFLARNLLREDGIIFIHIDDNEVHNLRLIMNEIFGEENFISEIIVKRASEIASNFTVSKHEYCLCYSKDFSSLKIDQNEKMTVSRGTVGNADQSMPVITFPAGLKCNNIPDGIYKKTRKIEGSQENIENLDEIEVANGELKKEVRLKAKWRSSNDMRNFFANNCQPTKAKISGELVEIYFENDRFVPQLKKRTFE